jgi:hypothetical protein
MWEDSVCLLLCKQELCTLVTVLLVRAQQVGVFLALNAAVSFVTGVSLQLARQRARSQTTCCSSARTLSLG